MNKGILIGAATSNSGKTTFTMGLLRALRNRGYKVQPFKCGPDYIDTMFHEMASGNESVNLDTFMASEEHVCRLFEHYGGDAECGVVEGVMGLFDGYDRWRGSSAEIAMLLDLPVVLVVSAKSVAHSVAATIYGFKNYSPEGANGRKIRLAGVVFNMIGSEKHYEMLKAACEEVGVRCFGYIRRNTSLVVPGRHLGLSIDKKEEVERVIEMAAEEVERSVDVEGIMSAGELGERELGCYADGASQPSCDERDAGVGSQGVESSVRRVAMARDEAFNFTYRANIDALKDRAEVVEFSPLKDERLPECDAVYLPGGYPELFAEALEANVSMRESIRNFAECGGKVFAECGGFMYLCRDIDGRKMCGVLPMSATMEGARLHLGYRIGEFGNGEGNLGNGESMIRSHKFHIIRGHEFHYSSVKMVEESQENVANCPQLQVDYGQKNAKGEDVTTAVYRYKNVTAGYTHWYWGEKGSYLFLVP